MTCSTPKRKEKMIIENECEREWLEALCESAVSESSREIAERALKEYRCSWLRETRLDWEADELV